MEENGSVVLPFEGFHAAMQTLGTFVEQHLWNKKQKQNERYDFNMHDEGSLKGQKELGTLQKTLFFLTWPGSKFTE